jgi:CelD/BcsL family acetyltransferase involved in cellulose biosynthesis
MSSPRCRATTEAVSFADPTRTDRVVGVQPLSATVVTGASSWSALADDWNRLALETPSPFLTHEWLTAWSAAFGRGTPTTVLLRDPEGRLAGGALLFRSRMGMLASPVNEHSGDWATVGRDEQARSDVWATIAALPAPVTALAGLIDPAPARTALEQRGRRVFATVGVRSPFLLLPPRFDDLLQGTSRNLRSQVGRRRRALERQGRLGFRTTTGGPRLARDLDAFLQVEAAGWKARAGTAIVSDPVTERLYRDFATAAADHGWLRLQLLELDGEPIAADLGCAINGSGFLIKTGFDEAHSRHSPGLVLRAEVLRASIEEGLAEYDFLGGPDAYKTRWTSVVRPRTALRAVNWHVGALVETYRRAVRPVLRRSRAAVRRSMGDHAPA